MVVIERGRYEGWIGGTGRAAQATAVAAPPPAALENAEIAAALDEVGELLAAQDAKPFRAQAYHRAAAAIRGLAEPLATLADRGGAAAIAAACGVGPSLARAILELVATGRLGLLDSLRGQADPEDVLATVPGIGRKLARRIHERLGIHTLEALESAAHDGRLGRVGGFGRRRLRGVIEALAGRLAARGARAANAESGTVLPVAEILDVDREYREKADVGALRRIAPRRFNPSGRAWLPILHTERGSRHYTALFSNTARAHHLGKTDDWVVIFLDDGRTHAQATVVSERRGPLGGRRVIRGRERECAEYYGIRSRPETSRPVLSLTP